MQHISVIGDGAWGTTLSLHLAKKGHPVLLWGAFKENVELLKRTRENKKFLPKYKIPTKVSFTCDIDEAVAASNIIVLATPSEYLEAALSKMKKASFKGKVFVSVVKGIHPKTFKRMSEMIYSYVKPANIVVLSGPTIAWEVAAGIPTTAVAACKSAKLAQKVQALFTSDTFRIYTNTDVAGVEVGGSIKNVIALACGICDGLGLGTNAKAAILTRGLAEITRLGVALGGRKETFYGLAGLGDLATTCFSPTSRNRCVGEAVGRGQSVKKVLGSMHAVAEGVVTAQAVYRLSQKKKIPMPIVTEVYKVFFEGKSAKRALNDLMSRQLKAE